MNRIWKDKLLFFSIGELFYAEMRNCKFGGKGASWCIPVPPGEGSCQRYAERLERQEVAEALHAWEVNFLCG